MVKNFSNVNVILIHIILILILTSVLLSGDKNLDLPTPQNLWLRCQETLIPFNYVVEKDEIIDSDSVPLAKLRRIELKFYSQEMEGRKWGHPCVIYMPADPEVFNSPEKRGKVVIVGQRS